MTPKKVHKISKDLVRLAKPVMDLKLLPGNPRRGNIDAVARSLEKFGQRKPVTITADGTVTAGNHTLQAAQQLGWTHIAAVTEDDDDQTAKAWALADNRTHDLGSYDDALLMEMIASIEADELLAASYDSEFVEELFLELGILDEDAAREQFAEKKLPEPDSLSHNVDLFFNASGSVIFAALAKAFNVRTGIISSALTPLKVEQMKRLAVHIGFVDNEFHDYDHDDHVGGIKMLQESRADQVEYATVRDVMTKRECSELGVQHLTLDEILDMAREVGELVENVIVIPKYDCISKIPDEFMLGYSLPSSYGVTRVPLESFAGRRIHLLGGSMQVQMDALRQLGESVVALDNNHAMMVAQFGQSYTATGKPELLDDLIAPLGLKGSNYGLQVGFSFAALTNAISLSGCTVNNRMVQNGSFDVDLAEVTDLQREPQGETDD